MRTTYTIVVETRDSTEPDSLTIEDVVNTIFDNLDGTVVVEVYGRDESNADASAMRPRDHHRREG